MSLTNAKVVAPNLTLDRATIELSNNTIHGKLAAFSGVQGEFVVAVIPSLNVSGYGRTEEEAAESLKENLDTFCEDLFALPEADRYAALKDLGWERNPYFKNQMSNSLVDEDGVLKNFDQPDKVKKLTIQNA
jgi:hypothetical protein